MTTTQRPIDLSLDIIRATNDGSNLSPRDLYVCQCACNGQLTDKGLAYLTKLHSEVTNGQYDKLKQYYYGVEHMTQDHEGYIYFKGIQCEHFSYPSNQIEKEKAALIRLQRICLLLEAKGIEINTVSTVWHVEQHLTKEELKQCEL